MANGCHRPCPGCRIRSLCWPLLLIAAGVLFSLDFIWRLWPIGKTWPILLILWGLCGMAALVGQIHWPHFRLHAHPDFFCSIFSYPRAAGRRRRPFSGTA